MRAQLARQLDLGIDGGSIALLVTFNLRLTPSIGRRRAMQKRQGPTAMRRHGREGFASACEGGKGGAGFQISQDAPATVGRQRAQ